MDVTNRLVRADTALCTIDTGDADDNIFRNFRRVFSARRCRRRMVFWFDERFGQTRLRQRVLADRASKKDDAIVAVIPGKPNLDILRFAIAARFAEKLMTGIRWELYSDFACRELVAMGRFDHLDLMADADMQLVRMQAALGNLTIPSCEEDWDFDAILITHRCPTCHRIFGRDNLAFNPSFTACGYCAAGKRQKGTKSDAGHLSDALTTASRLVRKMSYGPQGILPAANPSADIEPIELMLDVHATPLFIWLMCDYFKDTIFTSHGARPGRDHLAGLDTFSESNLRACYQQSILPQLKIDFVARAFEDFFVAKTRELIERIKGRPKISRGPDGLFDREWSIRQNLESIEDTKKLMVAIRELNDMVFLPYSAHQKSKTDLGSIFEAVRFLPLYLDEALMEIGRNLNDDGTPKETPAR
jgi:hypothetical protein